MKNYFIILFLIFAITKLNGQEHYLIDFVSSEAEIDSVLIENITQNTNLTIDDDDILHLILTQANVEEYVLQRHKLSIFPNPMGYSCNMEFENMTPGNVNITLFSINGKVIHTFDSYLTKGKHSFNLTGIRAGSYLVSIKTDSDRISGRFVSTAETGENFSFTYYGEVQSAQSGEIDFQTRNTVSFYGTKSIVEMNYSEEDQLVFTGYAEGFNNSIITDSPTGDTTYVFIFINDPVLPVITTHQITNIEEQSATGGGEVVFDGGEDVVARGVCWSNNENPTLDNSHTTDGVGTGVFQSSITDLSEGTTYFVRAYATNSVGTEYGNQVVFTTPSDNLPNIITSAISNVTETSAQSGGTIISEGNSPVIGRGVCWSTSQAPTLADFNTNDGDGVGNFTSFVEGLTPGQTYYLRAYAFNSEGVAYGNQQEFTTHSVPAVTTVVPENISYTTATSGGSIIYDGGAPITGKGVCWSNSPAPTIEDDIINHGTGTDSFVSNLTDLEPGTIYYIRSYATNTYGTGYGEEYSFTTLQYGMSVITTSPITNISFDSATGGGEITEDGGSPVEQRGICWNTSPNPTIDNDFSTDGSGIGSFVSQLTNLNHNTLYYVRAYATNSQGTSYGNEMSFTTEQILPPTVTTHPVIDINPTTAASGGEVLNNGGGEVTARGICWSTNSNPTIEDSFTLDGTGLGLFISNLTDLEFGTKYYVRAYATNNAGVGYGDEIFFTACGDSVTFTYIGNEVTYGSVASSGRCWLDRDLGASKTADAFNDSDAYGDFFQWGRADEGHQLRNPLAETHSGQADVHQPNTGADWDGKFIVPGGIIWAWLSEDHQGLWQGVNGLNNPCPEGWRIPNADEWEAERSGWTPNNHLGAIASPLQLPCGGTRNTNGSLTLDGSQGRYWSSDPAGITAAVYLSFSSMSSSVVGYGGPRAGGKAVRCILD